MINLLTGKLKNSTTNTTTKEFTIYNYDILYERLKLVSYMLIFTYPIFFIVDFFLLTNLANPTYKVVLAGVHLSGLVISVIFLMIYCSGKKVFKTRTVNSYILLYLLIGAISSINSQLLTGNIYAYLIIIFGVAVIFPVPPKHLVLSYSAIHGLFVIGLILIAPNNYSLLMKLINSTGAVVVSYMIVLTFYAFRKNDFLNRLKLRKNEESFRRLFHMNPSPLILAKRSNGEILLMNHQAITYYHLDPSQTDANFLFQNLQEKIDILTRLEEQKVIKSYVTEQQITADTRKWSMLQFEMVDYLDENCILIGTTDITAMKEKEEELSKYASIDMLTGVRNRRSGIELLQKRLSDAPAAEEFILCYIDINDLKKANDNYGHSTGDDLIKTCCKTINKHIDEKDVLFRLGGDEFIILFFQKQMAAVHQVWSNISMDFQFMNETGQKPYQISASHGYYHHKPGTVISLEEILELADQEMYKNKQGKTMGTRTCPT
ncbi:sensor domain-containing diguanylate cyclase [Neobacillus vireti]|nr:GGDEF domain-containing protein [Neobacillus vireti]